jgi:hypothetical protein
VLACRRETARVAQCGRQDGGVSPALPALHAAFSSTATFFTRSQPATISDAVTNEAAIASMALQTLTYMYKRIIIRLIININTIGV